MTAQQAAVNAFDRLRSMNDRDGDARCWVIMCDTYNREPIWVCGDLFTKGQSDDRVMDVSFYGNTPLEAVQQAWNSGLEKWVNAS